MSQCESWGYSGKPQSYINDLDHDVVHPVARRLRYEYRDPNEPTRTWPMPSS